MGGNKLCCFSCVQLFATLWTAACQAPLSKGFSRQEHWSGLPSPSPQKLIMPPQVKKIPLPFPASWVSLVPQLLFFLLLLFILPLDIQFQKVFISKLHKAQPLVEGAHAWQCTPVTGTDYMIGHANTHAHLWELATWRCICRRLTYKH